MLGMTLSKYLDVLNYNVINVTRRKIKWQKTFVFKDYSDCDFYNFLISTKPTHIVNCAGVINHKIQRNQIDQAFFINSIFPVFLSSICNKLEIKLIHISTDCVFSGSKGNYVESDVSDGKDFYSYSKKLGEQLNNFTSIIRTSIVGHEHSNHKGLLEWFLNSKTNKIFGYKNAYFSGLTTLELSKIILKYFIKRDKLKGKLVHVAGEKISKLELLKIMNCIYDKKKNIFEDRKFKIDKSLDSSYFTKLTKYKKISWVKLIKEMKTFNEKFF